MKKACIFLMSLLDETPPDSHRGAKKYDLSPVANGSERESERGDIGGRHQGHKHTDRRKPTDLTACDQPK